MKFAKELDEDLVPEWRVKYFNYKLGKKKIKAVSRALRNVNRTPQTPSRPRLTAPNGRQPSFVIDDINEQHEPTRTEETPKSRVQTHAQAQVQPASRDETSRRERQTDQLSQSGSTTAFTQSSPVSMHGQRGGQSGQEDDDDSDASSDTDNPGNNEHSPLQRYPNGSPLRERLRYGSIIPSPPAEGTQGGNLSALHLPDPALDPSRKKPPTLQGSSIRRDSLQDEALLSPAASRVRKAPTGATTNGDAHKKFSVTDFSKKMFHRNNPGQNDDRSRPRNRLQRAFTSFTLDSPAVTSSQRETYQALDSAQEEFFNFLDKEFDKIEKFYKQKEEQAAARLHVLREQLHEMRDRRLEDLRVAKKGGKIADKGILDGQIPIMSAAFANGDDHKKSFFEPVANVFNQKGKIGKTSQMREQLGSPRASFSKPPVNNDRGDYVRRQQAHEKVPYRFAKRKLKLALQEFYRGLELLKSYALLNRTAFRKINKKYDKAVSAKPPLRYMSEKVNDAHFVQSTFIEETLTNIEDLYARYFERGNRKIAVNKLRSHLHQGEQSSVSFRNGLYVAAGVGLALSGIVNGAPALFSSDAAVKTQASYLFQIYGGYLMAVLLFLFFVLDCRVWNQARINYVFVFEYDTRHTLDWRQLAELPCFLLFLNGLFLWLNFQFHDEHVMYIWWPVILIGLTAVLIFLPLKILYYNARQWFIYSNWRLLLAGLYPVEFRDFYLGDMYCSETYTLSQLEVFFCVYAHRWNDPPQCNSNHSRLLGFLTTLPAIWRALQCIRRYYDSRNWFPHLANFAKYCGNILYYMALSMYRIHLNPHMRALFIVFALINGLYCSFWDVFMDFSLGNPWSKNFLLRDNLAFRQKWIYYFIMVSDVILRQQWIFYAIFTEDLQHSAATSFFVALAEVIRRGLWSLIRVENEHCNNVVQFRASRDIALPYSLPGSRAASIDHTPREPLSTRNSRTDAASMKARRAPDAATAGNTDLEHAVTSSSTSRDGRHPQGSSTPGIRALQRVGTAIAAAHTQDFQKRRRPEELARSPQDQGLRGAEWSDEEDEDEDDAASRRGEVVPQRFLDSREDLSQPTDRGRSGGDDNGDADDEDTGGSAAASGSGGHGERDRSTMRRAREMNEAEIQEARDTIERAKH